MSERSPDGKIRALEPVHAEEETKEPRWTGRFVLFLRVMAAAALVKGLYHWSVILGIGDAPDVGFEVHTLQFQAATVFFAVIDLVAAVGLWLTAPWGAVMFLTAVVSMSAVELLFPQVYGGRLWIVGIDGALLAIYLCLALLSAREQPP